jgi:sterol desaturase/sphingolipid hydroxylase (fatty acid hydroxylase superfamily)
VDLRLPLVHQVAALADAYDAWVHESIGPQRARQVNLHVGGSPADVQFAHRWPESLRVFRTGWLEPMSHIPWWLILVVWVPIVLGLAVVAVTVMGMGPGTLALHVLGGLLAWTLTEYVLHRFVFHYKPTSGLGRQLHFLLHGIHHLDPWDRTRLVFPPVLGLLIIGAMFASTALVLPLATVVAGFAGFVAGYIAYDMTHYYTHHGRPTSRWGKFLKAWHLAHHHRAWNAMYGVSSPLWDYVLGTVPAEVRERQRKARA